ncbi:hypothetical protein F183_A32330 [Bryobacterales bacterium F-183]|nr:hypothetical protein F183_A32330 [Bryobacterales bacterium F-183]
MTTDYMLLASTLFNFLLPHLNYVRGKVADSALSESGKALVGLLKDKWLGKSEAAKAVVAAADPADSNDRDAILAQLKKALKADPEFAKEAEKLATNAGLQLSITGDNNKTAVVQGTGNTVSIS